MIVRSLEAKSVISLFDGMNSVIANNTIDDNAVSNAAIVQIDPQESEIKVYNNIIHDSGKAYNVPSYTTLPDSECDPKYIGQTTEDDPAYWQLESESNCINSGTQNGLLRELVVEDYFGNSRPQGSGYDIGFHEAAINIPYRPPLKSDFTPPEEEEDVDDEEEDVDKEEEEDVDDEEEEDVDDDPVPADPEPAVECGVWTDVSSNDQEYDIWMYLCNKGIVEGNTDGTLRPEEKLNRAELLALAFRASDYENVYNVDDDADYCFL